MNIWKTLMLSIALPTILIIPAEVQSGKLKQKQTHKKHYEQEARQQRREDLIKKRRVAPITVTKYNPEPKQTDSTPFIMASNKRVFTGAIALSRDLEEKYNLKFGDIVCLEELGCFSFQDRMNKKWTNRADLFEWSKKEAKRFGAVQDKLIIVR